MGAITNAVLTIFNDDFAPTSFNFAFTNFVAMESNAFAHITVLRSNGLRGVVSVDFATSDGTAVAGQNYLATNGTLVFGDNQAAAFFDVPLIDDYLGNADRLVNLHLLNPVGTNGVTAALGPVNQATLQIVNDDQATVSFVLATNVVSETAGQVQITVVRSNSLDKAVFVQVLTASGTATSGLDFLPPGTNGLLYFAPGQTSAVASVTIVDDLEIEGSEYFWVMLRSPSPNTNGIYIPPAWYGLSNAVVIILDNDLPGGTVDTNFNLGSGVTGPVYALSLLPDGRMFIGGDFTQVSGVTNVNRIARLNTNASLDMTFQTQGANAIVYAVSVDPNGQVALGGSFSQVNSTFENRLARLATNGLVDFSFFGSANNTVYALSQYGNSNLLVGGEFTMINGAARSFLARLDVTGSAVTNFNLGAGPNAAVRAMAVQSDGRIVIGGDFTTCNGTSRSRIAQLNGDGTLDVSFNPVSGANGTVYAVAIYTNTFDTNYGKVLIAGAFTSVNGVARNRLARLNADGSVDGSFNPGLGANDNVLAILVQPDGKILLGGSFTLVNGVPYNRIARLNPDGSLDTTINFGTGANNFVAALALQPDGKIILGGGFTEVNGLPRRGLARLEAGINVGSGSLAFSAANYSVYESLTNALITVARSGGLAGSVSVSYATSNLTAQAGLQYSNVSGVLAFMNGEAVKTFQVPVVDNLTNNPNWTFQVSLFNAAGGAVMGSPSNATVVILDNESTVGFSAVSYSVDESAGTITINVMRLGGTNDLVTVRYATANGTALAGQDYQAVSGTLAFNPGETNKTFVVPVYNDLLVDGNETVNLSLFNVTGPAFLGQSNAVLTILDASMAPGTVAFRSAQYYVRENQGDASIILTRSLGSSGVVSVDLTCADGTAVPNVDYVPVNTTVVFADGEVRKEVLIHLIDNSVSNPNKTVQLTLSNPQGGGRLGTPHAAVLTIIDNEILPGGLDPTFNSSWGADGPVYAVSFLQDEIVIGGDFGLINGANINGLARLFTNGVVDTSFAVGSGVDGPVYALAANNGWTLVGGAFSTLNGVAATNLARLLPSGARDTSLSLATSANNDVDAVAFVPLSSLFMSDTWYVQGTNWGRTNGVNVGSRAGTVTIDFSSYGFGQANTNITNNLKVYFGPFGFPLLNANLVNTNGNANTVTVAVPFGPVYGTANYQLQVIVNGGVTNTNSWSYTATITRGQPDEEQMIVAGAFTSINGMSRNYVARLNADGSLDPNFNGFLGVGPDDVVRAVAVQPDGAVIIGGDFRTVSGLARAGIARLSSYGAVDFSFNPGQGVDGIVTALALQPDGRVLIAGQFTSVDGTARSRVARLNANGSLDVSFDPGVGADQEVRAISLQDDGKILLGGSFTSFRGQGVNRLLRLNADGTLDPSFSAGTGPNDTVYALDSQVSSRSQFSSFTVTDNSSLKTSLLSTNNVPVSFTNGLIVLSVTSFGTNSIGIYYGGQTVLATNLTGYQFDTFSAPFGPGTSAVVSIVISGDPYLGFWSYSATIIPTNILGSGRMVVGGAFTQIDTLTRNRIAILDAAGAVDARFDPAVYTNQAVLAVALCTNSALPDLYGRMIVGGDFSTMSGVTVNRLARLYVDGTIDATFNVGAGVNGLVRAMVLQNDARVIVGGSFTTVDGFSRNNLARLNLDGTVDTTYASGVGVNGTVYALALQPDGKLIVGGAFTSVRGTICNHVARLNPDGTVDGTFNPGLGPDSAVRAIALQNDGKVVIGGDFTSVSGVIWSHVARLNTNGTIDLSFDPGLVVKGANDTVNAVAIQADGRIVIAGRFTAVNNTVANRVARFNTDGTVDSSFNPGGIGANDEVKALALQGDGRLLLGGAFTSYNEVPRNALARLAADGTIDTTINFGAGANNYIASVVVQAFDGSIVVGGAFSLFNHEPHSGIARVIGGGVSGAGTLLFSAASYSVMENVPVATITVWRVGGSDHTVTIDFATSNLTATAGQDYLATNGTLTFAPNEMTKTFTVPLTDDDLVEAPETVLLTLRNPTGGAGVADPTNAILTIISDDSLISFGASSYVVNEGVPGGYAMLAVTRTGYLDTTVQVECRTVDAPSNNVPAGLAAPYVRYIPTNRVMEFPPGLTSTNFLVRIIDDTLVEPNETFSVRLTNVTGLAAHLAAPSNAVVTIVDNDMGPGALAFSLPSYSFSEGVGLARIDVVRTNGTAGLVTVDYSTAGGTATPVLDYAPVTGTLRFSPGTNSQPIYVPIVDDLLVEGDETFSVMLSNVTGGAVLTASNVVVTIVDNESGPGTVDRGFDPGMAAGDLVRALALQAVAQTNGLVVTTNLKVLAGGAFTTFANTNHNYISRLNWDGSIDAGFLPPYSVAWTNQVIVPMTYTNIAGTIYLLGYTTNTTVTTNALGQGVNGIVSAVQVQDNGKILLGGGFTAFRGTNGTATNFNGVARNHLAQLLSDGSLDVSADQTNPMNAAVYALLAQPLGKFFAGGGFTRPAAGIVRIRPNGSADPSFDPALGVDGTVYALAVQDVAELDVFGQSATNQKVLIAGDFTHVNGLGRSRVARLGMDGSVDENFVTASVVTGAVFAVTGQSDGKVLIAGDFTMVNGVSRPHIARLNVDGSLDAGFDPGAGADAPVYALALQPDGKVVLGGAFTSVNNTNRNRLARLNTNGSLDTAFDIGSGANNAVYAMLLQPDGRLLIGGAFTEVSGLSRRGIARLKGDASPMRLSLRLTGGQMRLDFSRPLDNLCGLEVSTDMQHWLPISADCGPSGVTCYQETGLPAIGRLFFRVRITGP